MTESISASPIYIKAIPRSGGTLLATMLDAHPSIAMSYEIYEANLLSDGGIPLQANAILEVMEKTKDDDDVRWIKNIHDSALRTFLFRARRGGLTVSEVQNELKRFVRISGVFDMSHGRLDFIDALMKLKMLKEKKTIWGGKTQADLYQLHERYPDSVFLIMKRDIRDVFASMMCKGSFRSTAKEAAELWKGRIMEFREFVYRRRPRAMEVCYEDLATHPEIVIRKLCETIGIEYSQDMLRFHEKELTLFANPHGHLSCSQLQEGVNRKSIGRWRNELSPSDVEEIHSIAGELLNG